MMKLFTLKNNLLACLSLLIIVCSCGTQNNSKEKSKTYQCPMQCEGEKVYSAKQVCPVCNMDMEEVSLKIAEDENAISDNSIFNLPSYWNTQDNKHIQWIDLKGKILVVVMMYTNCQSACPRLVADLRDIAEQIQDTSILFVLVSFDPEKDTPQRLKSFALENKLTSNRWVLLQGQNEDVREFSNVLSVKYKQISPADFSHSNIFTIINKEGEIYFQKEGFSSKNEEVINTLKTLIKSYE